MARSVAAAESKVDMSFRSEPWHREENHDDVFKKRVSPPSAPKARSFCSATQPCHTRSPGQPRRSQIPRSGSGRRHCQQQRTSPSHLTLPPCRPHDQEGSHRRRQCPPESQPCSPPSEAAAPAYQVRHTAIRPLHSTLTTVGRADASIHS